MRVPRISCVLALLGWLALSSTSSAQGFPSSAEECEKAARSFDKEQPLKAYDEALGILYSCPGKLAEFYVDALAGLHGSTDVERLARWSSGLSGLRDGSVYSAATALVRDAGATPEARAMALVSLQRMLSPTSFVSYTGTIEAVVAARGGETRSCTQTALGHWGQREGGTPLPADAAAQRRALVQALLGDPSVPPLLRALASCMQR